MLVADSTTHVHVMLQQQHHVNRGRTLKTRLRPCVPMAAVYTGSRDQARYHWDTELGSSRDAHQQQGQ